LGWPAGIGRLMRNRNMLASMGLLAVSFFVFLALIRLPSSASPFSHGRTYVLETILAKYFLNEHVDWRRWAE